MNDGIEKPPLTPQRSAHRRRFKFVAHRGPIWGPLLMALYAWVLIAACSDEPDGHGQRCPATATYDAQLERCVTENTNPDAGSGSGADTGVDADGGKGAEIDSGPTYDAQNEVGHGDDSDAGRDVGSAPDVDSSDDTGIEQPPDTGPVELPECGGDIWDDSHDGDNPWEEPLIDCEQLSASWECGLTEDELRVLELVNEKRSEQQDCGFEQPHDPVDPVSMDAGLQCAARIHSWDMQGRGFYSHDTPEGVSASQRASMVSTWGSAGENIHNFSGSPEQVVEAWMNSPGHCQNIMRSHYVEVGVGRYGGFYTIKFAGSGFSW